MAMLDQVSVLALDDADHFERITMLTMTDEKTVA